jgi:hypothetical protein
MPQTIAKAFGSEPIEASKTGNCYSVANGMPIGNCGQKGAKGVLGKMVVRTSGGREGDVGIGV